MTGVHNIEDLLARMSPTLDESEDYVFLTVSTKALAEGNQDGIVTTYLQELLPSIAVGMFHEEEGLTVILPESYLVAQQRRGEDSAVPPTVREEWAPILSQQPLARMKRITMKIHSSLTAVGFTAAFSEALTRVGISCNVVAGYFHDHIFVPSEKAEAAMSTLANLSTSPR